MKIRSFVDWIVGEIEAIPWYISCFFEGVQQSLTKIILAIYLLPGLLVFPFISVKNNYPNFSVRELIIPFIILVLCIFSEYINKCVLTRFVPEIKPLPGNPTPGSFYLIFMGTDLMESKQRNGVGYLFFKIFMIPIFPIRCYNYEIIDNEIRGTRQTTTYRFYSRAKSNMWEILGIYLHFYTMLVLLIDMFFVMIDFYYFMFWLFS